MINSLARRVKALYEIGRTGAQINEIKTFLRHNGKDLSEEEVDALLDKLGKLDEIRKKYLGWL